MVLVRRELFILLLVSSVACQGFKTNVSRILSRLFGRFRDRPRVMPKTDGGGDEGGVIDKSWARGGAEDALGPDGGRGTTAGAGDAEAATDDAGRQSGDVGARGAKKGTGETKEAKGENGRRRHHKELHGSEEEKEEIKRKRKTRQHHCTKSSLRSVCLKRKMDILERAMKQIMEDRREDGEEIGELREGVERLKELLDKIDKRLDSRRKLASTVLLLNQSLTREREARVSLEVKMASVLEEAAKREERLVLQQERMDRMEKEAGEVKEQVKSLLEAAKTTSAPSTTQSTIRVTSANKVASGKVTY